MTTIRVGQKFRKKVFVRRGLTQVQKNKKDLTRLKRRAKAGELKFTRFTDSQINIDTAGSMQPQLFVIADGTTAEQRSGNKVTLTQVQATFEFQLPVTTNATETADVIRIILFIDKDPDGALPAVNDLLQSAVIESYESVPNMNRFRILSDRIVTITSMAGGGTAGTNFGRAKKYFRIKRKLNLPVLYSATSGLIATVRDNNVFILFISSNGLTTVFYTVRFRYLDN